MQLSMHAFISQMIASFGSLRYVLVVRHPGLETARAGVSLQEYFFRQKI